MNLKTIRLALALASAVIISSHAEEISVPGQWLPHTPVMKQAAAVSLPRVAISDSIELTAPEHSREALQASSVAAQKSETGTPLAIGFDRSIEPTATSDKLASILQWHSNPQGGHSAAIRLVSAEATATRIVLNIQRLHAAALVRFISEQTGEEVVVSGEEIINSLSTDPQMGRQYVGPTLDGAAVIVEIHLPEGITPQSTHIAIPALGHIFFNPEEEYNTYKDAADLSCMPSATCTREMDKNSTAVASIRYKKGAGYYVCSGTLVNDTANSGTANFITANHCISTQDAASTLESRWFYKSYSCGTTSLDSRNVTVRGGADLLFTQAATDTTLLRLKSSPPSGVYMTGWTTRPLESHVFAHILHHPGGKDQRYTRAMVNSTARCENTTEGNFSCRYLPGTMADDHFVRVLNTSGAMVGGSSGSGLLARLGNDYLYTGTLKGGASSCATPDQADFYGRFDKAFEAGLGAYLDPTNPGATNSSRSAIYRLYHTGKGTHFFTASAAERDSVVSKYLAYVYEGVAFYTYPRQAETLKPVYRFFNQVTGAHFYTISQAEKESIELKRPNFIYEGIAWYASTTSGSGTQPLYRFFNEKTGTHFYTTSAAEKDSIIAKYPSYIYEGIAYYVWSR